MKEDLSSQAYWKATIALLTKILIIWAAVSFGAGILFADMLNNIILAVTRWDSGSPSRAPSTSLLC